MPEAHTIMEGIPQPVLGPDDAYKEVSGREIFEELSITGLNRSPIEILTAFITADSELEGGGLWPEIPLADVCERVLVDGSFAVRYSPVGPDDLKQDEDYIWLEDCEEIHKRKIVQRLRDEKDRITTTWRIYERGETEWTVRTVEGYGKPGEQTIATDTYPLEYILSYPYGMGLIYPNQKTYRRLEEIEHSIRKQTGPASLSLIVTGYAGDWRKAQNTFAQGASVIGIPGNARVDRVASNNTADQLMSNSADLVKRYLQNMHLVEVSETSTMSGVSRKLAMMPMLNYVKTIRMVLDEVYEALGYTIVWGGLDITDTDEKIKELDFLDRGKRDGHLSIEEHQRMARALYGLQGEPEGTIEIEEEPEMSLMAEPPEIDTGEIT